MYDFWLHKLCDVYLEVVKPVIYSKTDPAGTEAAVNTLYRCLHGALRLTHPTMPFLTEELYQRLPAPEFKGESICIAPFPVFEPALFNPEYAGQMELAMNVIQNARSMIATLNIASKYKPKMLIHCRDDTKLEFFCQNTGLISTLAKIGEVEAKKEKAMDGCIMHVVTPLIDLYLQVKGIIDPKTEVSFILIISLQVARLEKKVKQLEGMITKISQKMAVKDYETKVPEEVRNENKEKLENTKAEIAALQTCITDLKKIA